MKLENFKRAEAIIERIDAVDAQIKFLELEESSSININVSKRGKGKTTWSNFDLSSLGLHFQFNKMLGKMLDCRLLTLKQEKIDLLKEFEGL